MNTGNVSNSTPVQPFRPTVPDGCVIPRHAEVFGSPGFLQRSCSALACKSFEEVSVPRASAEPVVEDSGSGLERVLFFRCRPASGRGSLFIWHHGRDTCYISLHAGQLVPCIPCGMALSCIIAHMLPDSFFRQSMVFCHADCSRC